MMNTPSRIEVLGCKKIIEHSRSRTKSTRYPRMGPFHRSDGPGSYSPYTGGVVASKKLERLFLDRMLKDLGWAAAQVLDGDEPPDFYVMTDAGRVSVEVTRIYRREHPKKGSPEAAQEREFEQFVRSLAHEYFTGEAAQAIQMSVALPPIIRSPKGEAVVAERETVGRSGGSREGTREGAGPAEIGLLGAAPT